MQYYAFVEERQKVHCLNTLFSKVSATYKFSNLRAHIIQQVCGSPAPNQSVHHILQLSQQSGAAVQEDY